MKVIGWISYGDTDGLDDEDDVGGMGGFFSDGMRWEDYISSFHIEFRPYLEAIREEVLKIELKCGGDEHQSHENRVPVFEDGKYGSFSFRAWGDLMAAIWSEAEDQDYSYMDFYMSYTMKDKT